MQSSFQPHAVIGHDGGPEVALIYCYILRPLDDRAPHFLTSYNEAISITGLPAKYEAATPQSFTPTQIGHGEVGMSSDFKSQQFTIQVPFNNPLLNPYAYITPSIPIEVTVIRVAVPNELTVASTWGEDTYIVQSGLLQHVRLAGEVIMAFCVPQPLHMATGLPRLWFNRTCQHALYGSACGLAIASWKDTGQLVLSGLAQRAREITIDGMVQASTNPAYYTSGMVKHLDTGELFTIYVSTYNHATGILVATIGHWSEAFGEDDEMEVYPGCRRTLADCHDKFSNKASFGGFPYIPNTNPTINQA